MARISPVLSEAEYVAIEEAIATTAKGRAFLRMRDGVTRVIGAEQVKQAIRELQDWIAGADSAPDRASLELIRRELSNVRSHIDRAKSEIRQIVATEPESQTSHIQGATAELDEIVNSTAQATNDILAAAEEINSAAEQIQTTDLRARVSGKCMDIFQACSFQDITGQRIAKVVKTLGYIEQRVNTMMAIGDTGETDPSIISRRISEVGGNGRRSSAAQVLCADTALLNGPQLPGAGLAQNDIDALLNDAPLAPAAPIVVAPAIAAPAGAAPIIAPPKAAPAKAAPSPVSAPAAKLGQDAIDSLFN